MAKGKKVRARKTMSVVWIKLRGVAYLFLPEHLLAKTKNTTKRTNKTEKRMMVEESSVPCLSRQCSRISSAVALGSTENCISESPRSAMSSQSSLARRYFPKRKSMMKAIGHAYDPYMMTGSITVMRRKRQSKVMVFVTPSNGFSQLQKYPALFLM